jgi:hypothetical protein
VACAARRGSGDVAYAARRVAVMWHAQLGGGSDTAHAARQGAVTQHAQLGGAWQCNIHNWEGGGDAVHVAIRGAAMQLVQFQEARKGTDSAKNTAESADKGKELLTHCQR